MDAASLESLAASLRSNRGIAAKADISLTTSRLLDRACDGIPVGDDCAAIPDGDGHLLLAIEGFMNEFVKADPWFAGWCGVMVNPSDIAAMGGRATAVVDAVWSDGEREAAPILDGMRAAAAAYGVPIVGGHTNLRTPQSQLSVAILGRAGANVLTSFDAQAGDVLIAAVDHRGSYREPFDNWQAAVDAPAARLRADLDLLPEIAERGLCRAAKDISQGGIPGTAIMLAECSDVGIEIDLDAVPVPIGVSLDRWIRTFPSYGFLLSVSPESVQEITDLFRTRDLSVAVIGQVRAGSEVAVCSEGNLALIWDHARNALLGINRVGVA